jgi:hypothetical protein
MRNVQYYHALSSAPTHHADKTKDYQKLFAPKCHSCELTIIGEWVQAIGSSWHDHCFVCQHSGCTIDFVSTTFFDHGGKPFCEEHFNLQIGSKCALCGKSITGKHVNALERKWHTQCFFCTFCKNSLAGQQFAEEKGKPYCKDCHKKLFV